ncbi:MAG: DUF3445 domain-containing protein [Bdellovibrionales bacterium]|nr:DUF3445 domain-containing protein [Bdellovibrionales bacterium]
MNFSVLSTFLLGFLFLGQARATLPHANSSDIAAAKVCPFLAASQSAQVPFWMNFVSRDFTKLAKSPNQIYVTSLSTAKEMIPEFHFDKGEFPQNNISPSKKSDIFKIDSEYPEQMEVKRRILQRFRGRAIKFLDVPGIELAKQETLELAINSLNEAYPGALSIKDGKLTNHLTNQSWTKKQMDEDPIGVASLLVTEDLVIMRPLANTNQTEGQPAENQIVGGALIFPTHWSVLSHTGMTISATHAGSASPDKVPALNRTINGLLSKMKEGHVIKRNNWMLMNDPTLAQPDYRTRSLSILPRIHAGNVGKEMFIRIERQTISSLPKSGFSLFTIKIYVFPLEDIASVPGAAQRLLNGLDFWQRSNRFDNDVPEIPVMRRFLENKIGK